MKLLYFGINLFITLWLITLFSCGSPTSTRSLQTIVPQKTVIINGLKRPWSMAFLSELEALVTEKDGNLLKVNLQTKEKTIIEGFPEDLLDSLMVFASDYPKGTYPTGFNGVKGKFNAGIFDVVLDPNFSENHWIYISYASEKKKKYATKFIRAELKENQLTNIKTLLLALPYADGLYHFGGGILFGNDGKLYLSTGERLFGDALQPALPIAQNYSDTRGKIFRLNADGSIPADNPDFGAEAVQGLFAVGLRNVQGMSLDPRTGDIWFTEHGTIQGDELNLLEARANYGWPIATSGKHRGGYIPPKLDRSFTIPKWFWHKTIAPTGLTFYTGKDFPHWQNNLIIPGLSRGNFWRLQIEDNAIKSVEELFIDERDRTRKAVQSPEGRLYILTDMADGAIIQITPAS